MTTYYVSSQTGNNSYAGTSQTAPLASLQTAANLARPGDSVEVMNGTYSPVVITRSGAAGAPITFEAAAGQTPVVDGSGQWEAIMIEASYINVKGFTVVGDAANYNLTSAKAGYSTSNAALDGNGIFINPSSSVANPNHITIANNTVYNVPGNGIGTEGADYVQILNNTVHNNGNWSAYGCSGISVSTCANSDSNAGPHSSISGNVVYNNAQLVPAHGLSVITDGEGIILDTNPGYTGGFTVANNTVYGNGSSGLELNQSNNVNITGNNMYFNDVNNVQSAANAEIFLYNSSNVTQSNNTFTAPSGGSTSGSTSGPTSGSTSGSTLVAPPVITKGWVNANHSITLTGRAAPNSALTMFSTAGSKVGTTRAGASGTWAFSTPSLQPGAYGYAATDTTSAGTSALSKAWGTTVTSGSTSSLNLAHAVALGAVLSSIDGASLAAPADYGIGAAPAVPSLLAAGHSAHAA